MSDAVASSLGIVAYIALFAGVGIIFIFANLLIGSFLRPADPHKEKLEIYECGEPAIGSSFVQFDLRFYVVALLFLIFDVEVALFFPWAAIFGKSNNLARPDVPVVVQEFDGLALTPVAHSLMQEMGVRNPGPPTRVPEALRGQWEAQTKEGASTTIGRADDSSWVLRRSAKEFAWLTILDIAVFFGVLLVGFAYVWKRGDLDWVHAISRERAASRDTHGQDSAGSEQFISA